MSQDASSEKIELTIERFKNIEMVDLTVEGISLLVGGNNAGKSSILQALQFGVSAAQTAAFQDGTWKGDRLSTSIGQSDLVYAPIKDVLSLARNGKLRQLEDEAIQVTYRDGQDECRVTVRKGRNKNILIELVGSTLGKRLQSVANPYSALVTGLAGIPAEEHFEANIVVRKAAAKGDSNSVFRNILLQLRKEEKKWSSFQEQFGSLFPGYSIDVWYDPDRDESIDCHVNRGSGKYPIDTCGTGVLQAIQIFAYVNLFKPRLLLLDEPDSHLHPNNQKILAKELVKIAESGTKIVLCSHSKHIIEALSCSSNFVWLRDGCQEEVTDKYEVEALMEIGALNIGESLSNKNASFIFLTEDERKDIFEILLEASGFDLEQCEIISYSGCTQVSAALAIISVLKRSAPKSTYVIHRDRDFLSLEQIEKYKTKLGNHQVKTFITSGNDLESYFVNIDHISESCSISKDLAEEMLITSFENRKDELISKYVNTIIENQKKDTGKVNAGEAAADASKNITGYSSLLVHGKTLLRGVRDEFRSRGIADRIFSISKHIRIQELVNFRVEKGNQ